MPNGTPPRGSGEAAPVVIRSNGGVLQATAGIADRVVSGLTGTPTLLVMVLLNVAMIAAAAWFLEAQEDNRHAERKLGFEMIEQCFRVPPAAHVP